VQIFHNKQAQIDIHKPMDNWIITENTTMEKANRLLKIADKFEWDVEELVKFK